jgi:ubiquinone/menaquinone biosynthesis C-methylase UbiE
MIERILNKQFCRPAGLLGLFIGSRMVHDHRPENLWTVAVLQPQPTDHILELGFGPGMAIEALAAIVTRGRIAGLDYSKTMVRAARRRNAPAIERGQVDLHHGDVSVLPFAVETFDKVFSIHSIYFWPEPLTALKEVRRVLKPQGWLTLTILPKEKWNLENPTAPVGTAECRPYHGQELTRLLTEAGFSTTHIEFDHDAAHPSNYSVIGVK